MYFISDKTLKNSFSQKKIVESKKLFEYFEVFLL